MDSMTATPVYVAGSHDRDDDAWAAILSSGL